MVFKNFEFSVEKIYEILNVEKNYRILNTNLQHLFFFCVLLILNAILGESKDKNKTSTYKIR